MNILRLNFFLLLLLLSFDSFCQHQKYLVLDKPGRVKRIRFYVGDEINFKLKGENIKYKDIITAITDSTIYIRGTHIKLSEIKSIIITSENGLLNSAIYTLPRAGAVYFIADTFNSWFSRDQIEISKSAIVVGSALIGSSLILRTFRKRTYRINNFRSLRVLETF